MAKEKRPLEKITLSGYKSIRELKKFPLASGLNVLIGANGSGKTNFIRFFELLGYMMDPSKGLQNYVASRGRADAFLFRGMKVTPEFSAHLKFGLNEYRFSLRAAADRSLFFSHESAPFHGPLYGYTVNDQGSGHVESALVRKPVRSSSEQWVVDTIQGWRVYHFHDTSPSAPVMGFVMWWIPTCCTAMRRTLRRSSCALREPTLTTMPGSRRPFARLRLFRDVRA